MISIDLADNYTDGSIAPLNLLPQRQQFNLTIQHTTTLDFGPGQAHAVSIYMPQSLSWHRAFAD